MLFLRGETDFYTTLEKALTEIDENWKSYNGLLISGTHQPVGVEQKIAAIKTARENKTPFLGICFGAQLAWIEYARNVLHLKDANSTEIDANTSSPVVIKLPELRVGIRSVSWRDRESQESHWHNYTFNKNMQPLYKDWEMSFSENILEISRLISHPFFYGIQFHFEYQNSKDKPHWVGAEFIEACKRHTVAGGQ